MIDEDLEPLITKCPNCATQFRVTENQLAAAGGRVRCGACLTVFQGTDYLLLDEDSTFSSGGEADAALDALLDELGSSTTGSLQNTDAVAEETAENPTDQAPSQQLYGGFEDEDEVEVEVEDATEAETEPEPSALTELEPDSTSPGEDSSEIDIPPELEAAPVEPADAEDGEDGEGAEDDEWRKEDYEKWIEPDTASIDRLVDEVVASGHADPDGDDLPALAGPPEASQTETSQSEAATGDSGFRLSAVEEALAAEGVGTQPISFAPEPRRWWVIAAAGALVVLLMLQIFYLQLPDWSRDPGLRGAYEAVCDLIGCELPEIRSLGALQTRNLVVRSHPELEGALIVDAIIVNQAAFAQRYPDLELKFTAVSGLPVAGRAFTPEEYLAGESSAADLMPVKTPVQISLTIADPGKEAVNYTLSFR